MALLSHIKDINVTFLQNIPYHMKDVFCRKKQITKNYFSWVFTERVTYVYERHIYMHLHACGYFIFGTKFRPNIILMYFILLHFYY